MFLFNPNFGADSIGGFESLGNNTINLTALHSSGMSDLSIDRLEQTC